MTMRMTFVALLAALVACGPSPTAAARMQSAPVGHLDQLLAPIALYPDSLLAQILWCAGDPKKVTELDVWLQNNRNLKGTQLQDAAVKAGFEPSFVALVLFPSVVSYMATQSQWTTMLGQAFAADRTLVFDSIQRLRHQAQDVGTLKDTPQQDVSTQTTSSGQQVIVIEPSNPQVVYVPQYNPQIVYTQAPAATTATTVVVQDNSSADAAVAAGLIGFTAGIAIGAAMDNNYYYGPYGWHGGAYMYNDAWDDYYDAREDAREDWMDHREDLVDERSDRLENRSEQRSDRTENRTENRSDRTANTSQQRTERQQTRQENRPAQAERAQSANATSATTGQRASTRTGSAEARGYGGGASTTSTSRGGGQTTGARSGGSSDAFSGYSSGKSQRASSARGQGSRSSARGGGGGGGRRR